MTEPLNPVSHVIEVELAIDQVTIVTPAEATATVRCMLGPVRRGARFNHIRDSAQTINLELTQIIAYFGRSVDELDPVHTGLVTLRGAGVEHLASASLSSYWQAIREPTRHCCDQAIHRY